MPLIHTLLPISVSFSCYATFLKKKKSSVLSSNTLVRGAAHLTQYFFTYFPGTVWRKGTHGKNTFNYKCVGEPSAPGWLRDTCHVHRLAHGILGPWSPDQGAESQVRCTSVSHLGTTWSPLSNGNLHLVSELLPFSGVQKLLRCPIQIVPAAPPFKEETQLNS